MRNNRLFLVSHLSALESESSKGFVPFLGLISVFEEFLVLDVSLIVRFHDRIVIVIVQLLES